MTSTEEKSEDKKEIEDEEREKMLNEENARESQTPAAADGQAPPLANANAPGGDSGTDDERHKEAPAPRQGEVEKMKKALEESEKDAGKKKIPIGGIRIPGFLRSRSREKNNKDGESEQEEENKDLLHDSAHNAQNAQDKDSMHDGQTPPSKRLPSLKLIPNPFKKGKTQETPATAEQRDGGEGTASGGGSGGGGGGGAPKSSKRVALLEAIQLPLVSILPRKNRAPKDAEIGQAGLASMETLDDKSAADTAEDGMESVKLDVEEKDGDKAYEASAGKDEWQERVRFFLKYRLIIGLVTIFVVIVIAIFFIAFSGSRAPISAPLATRNFIKAVTSCGYVEGVREQGGYAFRGIPYATPPLGENRWRPARLVQGLSDCWNGTLRTHNATSTCWQLQPDGSWDGDENCLTLDVYTPHVDYGQPLPVVVMIGAETLLGGSPGDMLPVPKLARDREIVFVRPNFRLGILGFLAHDALTMTTYPYTSGNYGLSDILAALEWVKLNIVNFGGDPQSVTVLGHRAGATLVTALLPSRKAQSFFHRVWLASGAATFPGKELREASKLNARFVNSVEQCRNEQEDDIQLADCLRRQDVLTLLDAMPDAWRPSPDLPLSDHTPAHEWLVLDGIMLLRHLFEDFQDMNESLPFKIVIGTTRHVAATDALRKKYDDWAASGEEGAKQQVMQWLFDLRKNRSLAEQAVAMYNGTSWPAFAAMVSDIRTVCPLLDLSRRMQKSSPVFYVVTQGRGDPEVADASIDAEAITARFRPQSAAQRRYMTAMQAFFYPFVSRGTLKRDNPQQSVLMIGQDANPSLQYPNCDLWLASDVVPRYARTD